MMHIARYITYLVRGLDMVIKYCILRRVYRGPDRIEVNRIQRLHVYSTKKVGWIDT